jgi:kynurenine formamidase
MSAAGLASVGSLPREADLVEAGAKYFARAMAFDDVIRVVEERDVRGFGTETTGTDAGQAAHFVPPYPAHHRMHGRGRYGLQCLTNLDLLPPTGALLLTEPLKIRQGSGSPLHVLALVETAP